MPKLVGHPKMQKLRFSSILLKKTFGFLLKGPSVKMYLVLLKDPSVMFLLVDIFIAKCNCGTG